MSRISILFSLVIASHFVNAQSIVPIYDIQGVGDDSPYEDSIVTTYGIVTDTTHGLDGFFLQDLPGDGNINTSDGIFIYENGVPSVRIGDTISVTGEVDEFFGLTELTNVSNISVHGQAVGTITPTDLNLPVDSFPEHFERLEGMLIRLPGKHVVTDNYNLGLFGELGLTAGKSLVIPTDTLDPNDSPPSGTSWQGFANVVEVRNAVNRVDNHIIWLDDMRSGANNSPIPWIDPVEKTLRMGSSLTDFVGCMTYSFSLYRIVSSTPPAFNYAARPAVPSKTGNLRVSGFNILNYWTTFGGRGADDAAEFDRQSDKLVEAFKAIDADVFAIMEFENNGTEAADTLVERLNQAIPNSADHYSHIINTIDPNTEPIQVGFLYKPSTVMPIGNLITDNDSAWEFTTLAQRFMHPSSDMTFGVVAVHYTFKGCSGATGGDQDQNDGQSCFNQTRREQSQRLEELLSALEDTTDVTGWLVLGDFNAYSEEDPMDMLRDSGYIVIDADGYSYAFRAQYGSLDHAVASNSSIFNMVQQANVWDINASEPRVIDYNTDNKGEDLYEVNAFRSSDHNPVILDLNLMSTGNKNPDQVSKRVLIKPNPSFNGTVNISWSGEDQPKLLELIDFDGKVIWRLNENDFNRNNWVGQGLKPGSYLIRLCWDDHVQTEKLIILGE